MTGAPCMIYILCQMHRNSPVAAPPHVFATSCESSQIWPIPPRPFPIQQHCTSHHLAFLDPVYLGGADRVRENSWLGSTMHLQLRVTHATWIFENDQVMLRAFHWNPALKCRWSMHCKGGAAWRNEQLSSLLWQWKKLYLIGENLSKQMLGEVFIFPLSFFLFLFLFSIYWVPPEED